jgi:hypothetical protein
MSPLAYTQISLALIVSGGQSRYSKRSEMNVLNYGEPIKEKIKWDCYRGL